MDTIDEGKSNRHVAVTSKIPPCCFTAKCLTNLLTIKCRFCIFEADTFRLRGFHFSFRHERAQLQESQYFPDKRQTGEHPDRAEAQRQTLPGGSGWQ